jgi:hypothetical protein
MLKFNCENRSFPTALGWNCTSHRFNWVFVRYKPTPFVSSGCLWKVSWALNNLCPCPRSIPKLLSLLWTVALSFNMSVYIDLDWSVSGLCILLRSLVGSGIYFEIHHDCILFEVLLENRLLFFAPVSIIWALIISLVFSWYISKRYNLKFFVCILLYF